MNLIAQYPKPKMEIMGNSISPKTTFRLILEEYKWKSVR